MDTKIDVILNSITDEQTFRLCVVGQSGSGKSYFVLKLIESAIDKFKKNKRKMIVFVITPVFNNKAFKEAGVKKKSICNDTSINGIITFMEHINEWMQEEDENGRANHKIYRGILVFDDIVDDKLIQKSEFMKFYATARHLGVSIIYVAHQMHVVISSFMRAQCTHYIIFCSGDFACQTEAARTFFLPHIDREGKSLLKMRDEAMELYMGHILRKKYNSLLWDVTNSKLYLDKYVKKPKSNNEISDNVIIL